jgi:hypothetical protein
MKPKPFLAVALVLLAPALAGCEGRVPPDAQGKEVVRPALRYAMNVPSGWTVRDLGGDVVLEVLAPSAKPAEKKAPPAWTREAGAPEAIPAETKAPGGAAGAADRKALEPEPPPIVIGSPTRPVVHVLVIEREERTLPQWADRAIQDCKELQPDLEETHREAAKLADGREALRLTLKNPRAVEPLIQEMLLVMTDSTAYAVIATASQADLPTCQAGFKTCLDSFIVW